MFRKFLMKVIILTILSFGAVVFCIPTAKAARTRKVCLGKMRVTYYCAACNSCGPYATSLGVRAKPWRTVAVNHRNIKLGSKIKIKGYKKVFVAHDSNGGANFIDIFVPTKNGRCNCNHYGVKYKKVWVIKEG